MMQHSAIVPGGVRVEYPVRSLPVIIAWNEHHIRGPFSALIDTVSCRPQVLLSKYHNMRKVILFAVTLKISLGDLPPSLNKNSLSLQGNRRAWNYCTHLNGMFRTNTLFYCIILILFELFSDYFSLFRIRIFCS